MLPPPFPRPAPRLSWPPYVVFRAIAPARERSFAQKTRCSYSAFERVVPETLLTACVFVVASDILSFCATVDAADAAARPLITLLPAAVRWRHLPCPMTPLRFSDAALILLRHGAVIMRRRRAAEKQVSAPRCLIKRQRAPPPVMRDAQRGDGRAMMDARCGVTRDLCYAENARVAPKRDASDVEHAPSARASAVCCFARLACHRLSRAIPPLCLPPQRTS